MFEKLKFPISKAFQMIFAMVAKDGATSMTLAETLNLQQRTCWAFRLKVQQAMSHLHPKPLSGIVKVGFFNLINDQSDTYYWRFDKPKQRIAVALEVRDKKIIKAMADVVQDSKIDDLRQFIDAHITREAQIEVAETRRGYKKLEKEYPSLKVYHGLLHLNRYFDGLKKWIYEVNYRFTYEHLQGYLDEYNFRINNRQNSFRKFETIVRAMMKNVGD